MHTPRKLNASAPPQGYVGGLGDTRSVHGPALPQLALPSSSNPRAATLARVPAPNASSRPQATSTRGALYRPNTHNDKYRYSGPLVLGAWDPERSRAEVQATKDAQLKTKRWRKAQEEELEDETWRAHDKRARAPSAAASVRPASMMVPPSSAEEVHAKLLASNPRMAALPAAAQKAMIAATQRVQAITDKAQAEAAKAREALMAQMQQAVKPTRFTSELEINDYPQMARYKVMRRESLQAIQEWNKVAITTKGAYYPPGRNPPAGERKLYLLIEGETEPAVKSARKEMRCILEEAAAVAAPDDTTRKRYARYNV